MKLSHYQKRIGEFTKAGKGNGRVGGVAGCGKTFTLVNVIAPLIAGTGQFLAFNKSIAEELGKKLPSNMRAKTGHSMALSGIRKVHKKACIDGSKYKHMVRDYLEYLPGAPAIVRELVEQDKVDLYGPLLELTSMARLTLTDANDPNALLDLALHHSMDLPDCDECEAYLFESVKKILDVGRKEANRSIDFDDMLWLCATDPKMVPYQTDWVLVDECQDLSKAMLECIKKAGKRGARFIFVGDEFQSINGFAGADCNSFHNIGEAMKTTDLPLSICYRCPTSHLDLAREIVPHIEARPGAPLGTIEHCQSAEVTEKLIEGDLLISRVNAPLVSLCFALIADGKPARIKGRNIGEGLVATAKKISKRRDFPGWPSFNKAVDAWCEREIQRLVRSAKGNDPDETRVQARQDNAECLRIIWARAEARSLRDFKKAVDDIFSNDKPGIQLSSIHRAKGLEADRVFIYNPDLLPGPWAHPGSWQYQQELNLRYVALSRSRDYLCFVHIDKEQKLK